MIIPQFGIFFLECWVSEDDGWVLILSLWGSRASADSRYLNASASQTLQPATV